MYESYLTHIQEFWKRQTTIDRIDVNGNYNKDNCRWATMKEQGRNKRNTVLYKWKSLSDYCTELWIKYTLVYKRIHELWWDIEKAIWK